MMRSDVLFFTGASDAHFLSSLNTLYSMLLSDGDGTILYCDLGLGANHLSTLFSHFQRIHAIQNSMHSTGSLYIRKYNWNAFPSWMRPAQNHLADTWKAIASIRIMREWRGVVVWCDASHLLPERYDRDLSIARNEGIFVPLLDERDPLTIPDFFFENGIVSKNMHSSFKEVADFYCIVDSRNRRVWRTILWPLYQCSYTKRCVHPHGSVKGLQAALSPLLHLNHYVDSANSSYIWQANPMLNTTSLRDSLLKRIQERYHLSLVQYKCLFEQRSVVVVFLHLIASHWSDWFSLLFTGNPHSPLLDLLLQRFDLLSMCVMRCSIRYD